jgi:amino acid efflux transporter
MLTAVLVAVYFVLMLLNGMNLSAFILIHTSNMVAIYAAGMVAATLLLRRWSFGWWLAVVATVMTVGLLVLAWANLIVPLVLAVAAVVVTVVRRLRRRSQQPAASPAAPEAAPSELVAASMASDLRTASQTHVRETR